MWDRVEREQYFLSPGHKTIEKSWNFWLDYDLSVIAIETKKES